MFSQNVLIQGIGGNSYFGELLTFFRLNLGPIFLYIVSNAFKNKYVVRCFVLKYGLLFVLAFLYFTDLRLANTENTQSVSLYFKEKHLIICNHRLQEIINVTTTHVSH